mmetsp:Transcript_41331/g.96451  ORF Transcript_41331/g.96451 Transcript_41331/m.96451 type:complete len:313 (+) Transcript_41331:439-1377(+)
MYLGVKLRAPVRAVLFEIIHPFENFLNATWQKGLHLCSASSSCYRTVTLSVDNEDLPVSLAFINEAHCSKRPANNHISNTGRCLADVNHIQGVIITRSIVKFVVLGWITVCLWKASVVKGNRSAEGSQPPGSFCVLTKNVVLEGGLELELLQGSLRHLVDVPEESCVLIQPILHKQLRFMPVRSCRVRGVPDRDILLFGRLPITVAALPVSCGTAPENSTGVPDQLRFAELSLDPLSPSPCNCLQQGSRRHRHHAHPDQTTQGPEDGGGEAPRIALVGVSIRCSTCQQKNLSSISMRWHRSCGESQAAWKHQ